MSRPYLLFATRPYLPLCERMADLGGFERGRFEETAFPDGERSLRLLTDVAGRDVVLLGGTVSDADTLTLYDMASGLVAYGARTLTLMVPYFGYATMERATRFGEIVTAKTRAMLFSHLRCASAGNRIVLLDLHADGIPYYFESTLRPVHLSARPLILAAAQRLGGPDFVVACTDAGRAKWVESLANDLQVPVAFVFKRRVDGAHTEVSTMSAQVEGKCVVIYDDMIRTGSSLIKAAEAYRAAGAQKIVALCTHGLFTGDALERLQVAGLFDALVCTDSHPRAATLPQALLQIHSIAGLLTDYLLRASL